MEKIKQGTDEDGESDDLQRGQSFTQSHRDPPPLVGPDYLKVPTQEDLHSRTSRYRSNMNIENEAAAVAAYGDGIILSKHYRQLSNIHKQQRVQPNQGAGHTGRAYGLVPPAKRKLPPIAQNRSYSSIDVVKPPNRLLGALEVQQSRVLESQFDNFNF